MEKIPPGGKVGKISVYSRHIKQLTFLHISAILNLNILKATKRISTCANIAERRWMVQIFMDPRGTRLGAVPEKGAPAARRYRVRKRGVSPNLGGTTDRAFALSILLGAYFYEGGKQYENG